YLKRAAETLQTHVLADDDLTPWHRAFREAGGEDSIVHPVNIVDGVRWHSGFAYVDPARGRENLTILADTLVDRVLVDEGRATGAVAAGQELEADTVVVSAGAYGSPGATRSARTRRVSCGPGSRSAPRRTCERPRAASSIRSRPARSGACSTSAAAYSASRTSTSSTPRQSRRSRARTRT